MTEILERADLLDVLCPPHSHTARCWWNVDLGGWVCPPTDGGPT
jgi:hypothetical protein